MATAVLNRKPKTAQPGKIHHKRQSKSASPKTSVRDKIADRIIQLLDQGDLPPWEKGWNSDTHGVDKNAVSNAPYRGINRWLTLMTRMSAGYQDSRWLTFLQAKAAGGSVRKGETGTTVVFWLPPKEKEPKKDDHLVVLDGETEKITRSLPPTPDGYYVPTLCST